jgi:hypothetical protein
MEFKPFEIAEDEKDYGYMYGKRSEDGKYEIMVGVVMFGYRVYVRTANNRTLFLKDLCAGPSKAQVKTLYSWIETHLSKDKPISELLNEIPTMKVKPYSNDRDFMVQLMALVAGEEFKNNYITQEGLQEGRDRLFKNLNK